MAHEPIVNFANEVSDALEDALQPSRERAEKWHLLLDRRFGFFARQSPTELRPVNRLADGAVEFSGLNFLRSGCAGWLRARRAGTCEQQESDHHRSGGLEVDGCTQLAQLHAQVLAGAQRFAVKTAQDVNRF